MHRARTQERPGTWTPPGRSGERKRFLEPSFLSWPGKRDSRVSRSDLNARLGRSATGRAGARVGDWRYAHGRDGRAAIVLWHGVLGFDRLWPTDTAHGQGEFLQVNECAHESGLDMRTCFGVCAVLISNVTQVKDLGESGEPMFTGAWA